MPTDTDTLFDQMVERLEEMAAINARLSDQLERHEAQPEILVQRLSLDTPAPARMTPGSAGWDLVTTETLRLFPGERRMFPLGIRLAIPEGYAGFIWPRSGLSVHHSIDRLAGLIDADYRGEVKAALINHGEEPVFLHAGERVAQLVVVPCLQKMIEEVDDLPDTHRGAGGFGSSGK